MILNKVVFCKHHYSFNYDYKMLNAPGDERSQLTNMIFAWRYRAEIYKERKGRKIGENSVLGEPWVQVGKSIIDLLQAESHHMDVDAIIILTKQVLEEYSPKEEDV